MRCSSLTGVEVANDRVEAAGSDDDRSVCADTKRIGGCRLRAVDGQNAKTNCSGRKRPHEGLRSARVELALSNDDGNAVDIGYSARGERVVTVRTEWSDYAVKGIN